MGTYRPRHAGRGQLAAAAGTGRPRVTVFGRSVERLTFVRVGLVLIGTAIVVGSLFLPNTNKPAPASAFKQTGIVTRPVSHSANGALAVTTSTTLHPSRGTSPARDASPSGSPTSTVTTDYLAMSSPALNLPSPEELGPELRQAWVAADPGGTGLSAADVRSTVAGSVYYASQPSIATHWAIARFVPTAMATGAALAQFSSLAAFQQTPGSGWSYLGESSGPCGAKVPMAVLQAWGMCKSPGS